MLQCLGLGCFFVVFFQPKSFDIIPISPQKHVVGTQSILLTGPVNIKTSVCLKGLSLSKCK